MRDLIHSGIVVRSVADFGMVIDIGCHPFPDAERNDLRGDLPPRIAPATPPPASPAAVR